MSWWLGFESCSRACRSAIRAMPDTLVGPLIDEAAFEGMQPRVLGEASSASRPSRAASMSARRSSRSDAQEGMVLQETFAPILYVLRYARSRRGDRAQQFGRPRTVVVDLHQ